MIGKLLFTIVVILIVMIVARSRLLGRNQTRTSAQSAPEPGPKWPRYIAYGFVAVVLVVGASFYYIDWQQRHEVFTVRVINSRTGNTATYQVSRGDMRGRSFTTRGGPRDRRMADNRHG